MLHFRGKDEIYNFDNFHFQTSIQTLCGSSNGHNQNKFWRALDTPSVFVRETRRTMAEANVKVSVTEKFVKPTVVEDYDNAGTVDALKAELFKGKAFDDKKEVLDLVRRLSAHTQRNMRVVQSNGRYMRVVCSTFPRRASRQFKIMEAGPSETPPCEFRVSALKRKHDKWVIAASHLVHTCTEEANHRSKRNGSPLSISILLPLAMSVLKESNSRTLERLRKLAAARSLGAVPLGLGYAALRLAANRYNEQAIADNQPARPPKRRRHVRCGNCSEAGHNLRTCKAPCPICNTKDHKRNTCPRRPAQSKGVVTEMAMDEEMPVSHTAPAAAQDTGVVQPAVQTNPEALAAANACATAAATAAAAAAAAAAGPSASSVATSIVVPPVAANTAHSSLLTVSEAAALAASAATASKIEVKPPVSVNVVATRRERSQVTATPAPQPPPAPQPAVSHAPRLPIPPTPSGAASSSAQHA